MMMWSKGLSDEQINAAGHWGSSARILAGPGTGKTRTLTNRVAYLLDEKKIPAEQVIVLTFTRAAANELRARLTDHLNLTESILPNVSTVHSFALRILLKHAKNAGIIQPLRVADDYEEKHILHPELGEMIHQTPGEIEKALRAYEATWNTLDSNHEVWEKVNYRQSLERELNILSRLYGFVLRGQLVFLLLKFLEANPLITESLGIKHVLVDEYQDLNYCDQQAITRFEEAGAELFVVGDDDQCIYQFRHAYPEGIREFIHTRPGAGDYQLTVCHRCPKPIVELGNSLIGWEKGRLHKRNQAWENNAKGDIHVLQFQNQDEEAKGIADICRSYINSGLLSPRDISILLSTRRLAKPIQDALEELKVPVASLSSTWPLGGRDDGHKGRLVYCILRLAVDRMDLASSSGHSFNLVVESPLVASVSEQKKIDSAVLRDLLTDAFSDEELQDLAFDRFPGVYDEFGSGMSKKAKVSRVISYCTRQVRLDDLLVEIKVRNPSQFTRFEGNLYS